MEDILVGIMCVFALCVGIWAWWYENHGPGEKEGKGEENIENLNNNE